MKYLLLISLFLTGCIFKTKTSDSLDSEAYCHERIEDAKKQTEASTITLLKGKDNPELIYGAHVRFTKGFYKGQTGVVISTNLIHYWVKPDKSILDEDGKKLLSIIAYSDDLEVIK
jgi:hypothetical protein